MESFTDTKRFLKVLYFFLFASLGLSRYTAPMLQVWQRLWQAAVTEKVSVRGLMGLTQPRRVAA